jgi:putative ATP-dependent endonuclease of the OLD family
MYLKQYCLRNFRRLESAEINLQENETIFVGANNSGKTSATAAFRLFVSQLGNFKIHDFFSPSTVKFDNFGKIDIPQKGEPVEELPTIELDLWFAVDPSTEYGRIANFLPSLASELTEIGVRICFSVNDPIELHNAYRSMQSKANLEDNNSQQRTLSYFLSKGDNLKRYFSLKYFMLEKNKAPESHDNFILHAMDKDQGQKTLKSLLRVDYVDAQRNIDDSDSKQSNRLSAVFANFYKQNLKEQEHDTESFQVIDQSNLDLTAHYAEQFAPIIDVLSELGFPAIHDRELRIISNLSPEQALSGNTSLTYIDRETEHELPEAYNGLGFKNLIYIAIQIAHFQIQWIKTEVNRPLCQLIFIEEPEVHLHAQVQQTFIRQIRKIVEKTTSSLGTLEHTPQLIVTTHSSHIMAEADFQDIRYFRRAKAKIHLSANQSKLIATDVINLANFNNHNTDANNLKFLKRFLKLTHCDLFFADAAILVEGTVERLLMPLMIKKEAPALKAIYLTTLELGGAYAHRFTPLLEFIGLPTLIITDLDSVNPSTNHSACRADTSDAVTSNGSIKELTQKNAISDLLSLSRIEKTTSSGNYQQYITFQQSIPVTNYGANLTMIPRTFEEAFIYENISAIRNGELNVLFQLPSQQNYEDDYNLVYDEVKSKNYAKTEFALNQIDTDFEWVTPSYVSEGLKWLSETLKLQKYNELESELPAE